MDRTNILKLPGNLNNILLVFFKTYLLIFSTPEVYLELETTFTRKNFLRKNPITCLVMFKSYTFLGMYLSL